MNVDTFFTRGRTHTTCQDFARAGVDAEGEPYLLLSDGCSSSPDTDTGARLLVLAAEHCLLNMPRADLSASPLPSVDEVVRRASTAAAALELPASCLDATLLAAVAYGDLIYYMVIGDGVVLSRRKDTGELHTVTVENPSNAPLYPSYLLSEERLADYTALFGDTCAVTSSLHSRVTAEPLNKARPGVFGTISREEHDLVALLSDGVTSFRRRSLTATSCQHERIPLQEVLGTMMDIKNGHTAQFLSRRIKRFLERTCVSRHWRHDDDLSVACMSLSNHQTSGGPS